MESVMLWFQSFLSVIKTFQVKDAVDILCVTAVIYAVIKFVRDTKAVQLLKGAVLFIVVYFISSLFNLTMFSTLLKMFMEFGVLIIIIVFQPEIRNALEKIGRSKFSKSLGFSTVDEDEKLIERNRKCIKDVSMVARSFSKQKVGALIVFERETKLGDIINTGTIIDALPSVSLFGNMFFNKAPLHDGAVIIRGGKIYSAGCILPLTKRNSEVDVNLGTRHRAAIGMSEESDAVVVVVSEETGNISLVCHGKLTRMEDSLELQDKLEQLLLPEYTKNDIADFIPIFSAIRKEKKTANEQATQDKKD